MDAYRYEIVYIIWKQILSAHLGSPTNASWHLGQERLTRPKYKICVHDTTIQDVS